MPFFPPFKSFFEKRYLFMIAGLFTVMLHAIITALFLKYFLIGKYGMEYLSLTEKSNEIGGDAETIQSFSILFYPILFIIVAIIYFINSKGKEELRINLRLYLITTFLVFGYIWFFLDSVLLYILPSLMIIGFLASYRGRYQEAQRIFIFLFLVLIIAFGANKLSEICF